MPLKLYYLAEGPPSISIRQLVTYLDLPIELINVDFGGGEHLTEEYTKMNPQQQIPVLDDDGFLLSESNAILQYICDKYAPKSNVYPQDPQQRAIVNHRLCFHNSTYYNFIDTYALMPLFYDYDRTPLGLKKVHIGLEQFNTYLKTLGKTYAAADHVTIADFQLVNATMGLEVIDFDFSQYTEVSKWYNLFKTEHPKLWALSEDALKGLKSLITNRPDLSALKDHPLHAIRK